MLPDVVDARHATGYRIWLRFDDGVEAEVDLEPVLSFEGVFAPLRDPQAFAELRVDPALGTICWPNQADLDPVVLYALATHRPVDEVLAMHPEDACTGSDARSGAR